MLIFKFISCTLAILLTLLFIVILLFYSVNTSNVSMKSPWKEGTDITGEQLYKRLMVVIGLLLSLFWSVVIVL